MKVLQLIEDLVFRSPLWKLLVVIACVMFVKIGVWPVPNLDHYREMASNPFANPFRDPIGHYMFWNWLGPFMAWLAHAREAQAFFLFHFAFSLGFTWMFVRTVFVRLPDRAARVALVLFTILPVSGTAYFWVGPDSITLFFMLVAIAYPRHILVTLMAGLALGMQHFEQGLFAASGLLFAITLSNRLGDEQGYSIGFCLYLLAGVVAGKMLLLGIFDYNHVVVNSGRVYITQKQLPEYVNNYFFHFPGIFWSALGFGWLVALKYLDTGLKAAPLFMVLIGALLLLSMVDDQTRVFSIVSFLPICVYWLLNTKFLAQISGKEASWLFLLWIIMPWSWVWHGEPKWSAFPYDVAYILHNLFGWFTLPDNPAKWPFLPTDY